MVGGGPGKIQQLFANKVVKGSLKPEPCPDRFGRLALLDPNLMGFTLRHGASNPIDISGCAVTAIPQLRPAPSARHVSYGNCDGLLLPNQRDEPFATSNAPR
jgi:hypothetical protein